VRTDPILQEDYPNITRQDVAAALEFMELDVNP
jgi:uncharacterized protein (DUF433 family)